jgi:hypothetical protein
MLMMPVNMTIQLAKGKSLTFRDARDVQLECTEGKLWLTIEGLHDDYLLGKGERVRIVSNGLAIVQGFPSGSAQLDSKVVTPSHG